MDNKKRLALLGVAGTVMGIGVSLFSGWVSNQKVDDLISEKVQKELEKQKQNND